MADLGVRAASKPQGGTEMLCMQKDKVKSREAARAPDSGAVHCVEEPGRDAELGTRPPAPSRNSAEENVKPTAMDEEARRAAEAEREASRARIKEVH